VNRQRKISEAKKKGRVLKEKERVGFLIRFKEGKRSERKEEKEKDENSYIKKSRRLH